MADPGLSRRTAEAAAADLQGDLSNYEDDPGQWEVRVSDATLPLTPEGDIPLMNRAADLRDRYGWDYVVYLTDLPRYYEKEPLLCEVSAANPAALVSLTALGAFHTHAKTRKLLVALIRSAQGELTDGSLEQTVQSAVGIKTARQVDAQGKNDTAEIVLPGRLSQLRLLSGMVRSNNPGSMLPALATSITAAVATGGFGIYYGSVWTLADALHPARLIMISVVVVAALSFWLIFRNGLWNKHRKDASPWQSLDNVTTIIMVSASVTLMYLLVATVLFGIGLAVIDASYLHSELQHPVTILDYVKLSWLSASLGALAGALGSNFDSDEKIRAATYSKRQHERRQRTDSYNN